MAGSNAPDCPAYRGSNSQAEGAPRVCGGDLRDRRIRVIQSSRPHVLREYSLIADGERGALIGPDGAISWLCAPRWDSPAVFGGLLGGPAGLYTEEYDVHQRQLRGKPAPGVRACRAARVRRDAVCGNLTCVTAAGRPRSFSCRGRPGRGGAAHCCPSPAET